MRKRAVLFALLSLVTLNLWAPCFYDLVTYTEYWQYHTTCGPSGCRPGEIYSDWWSLDGECYHDCNGTVCYGDTEVRYRTMTEQEILGTCEICVE